ncbi:MAG: hypothetical protein M3Z64_01615, partial [Verrucomicrobiota bacterium]|nr:hypothetical protein [Verrucomicrobiota bacterium]
TDMETCYKVFRRSVLGGLALCEDRFGFEPEITAKVARSGCRIYEVGISYDGRTYEEGKKITWRDGIRAVYAILKYNLFARAPRPHVMAPSIVAAALPTASLPAASPQACANVSG